MRVCLAARSLARGTNALLATAAAMRPAARSVLMSSSAGVKPNISLDKSRNGLITIAPGEGAAHTATVIGPIHGLGDTNMGWADAALQLHTGSLGHVKFVLPNAPTAPVTLNGGMPMPSWYDITSLDDRANQECEGIESARELINSLIAAELSDGIPLHRIVVGGFSQGESPTHRAAVSLYAGLQYPGTLGGVLALSGYLPRDHAFVLSDEAKSTNVLACHGVIDPTVRLEWATTSKAKLEALGVTKYELRQYADLGHGANQQEIADVEAWLHQRLPPL